MYVIVTTVAVVDTFDKVAVKVVTPAAFSAIDVVPLKVTVGASLSMIVTVAVCTPFSDAPFPPVTFVISIITDSLPSEIKSEVGSISNVAVVEPAGIVTVIVPKAKSVPFVAVPE